MLGSVEMLMYFYAGKKSLENQFPVIIYDDYIEVKGKKTGEYVIKLVARKPTTDT